LFSIVENVERAALQLLLHQVAEVLEDIRTMKAALNELLRRQRGIDGIRTDRLPDDVKLPVKTPSEMRSLEPQLESYEMYSQL
jgi:hypothetical protein